MALNMNQTTFDSPFVEGNSLFRQGKYEDAIKAYLQAIDRHPGFEHYYVNLSEALLASGRQGPQANEILQAIMAKGKPQVRQSVYRLIREGKFVNRPWYRERYALALPPGVDPTLHYLALGWRLGFDPSTRLQTRKYLRDNARKIAEGENPLVHYAQRKFPPSQRIKSDEPVPVSHKAKRALAANPLDLLRDAVAAIDSTPLKQVYESSTLASEPDTFCLVRVIGNDLYPRHQKGQSRENVRFILENEPALEGCQRLWILNRIIDQGEREALLALLNTHQQDFVEIPFKAAEYHQVPFDFACLPAENFLFSRQFQSLEELEKARAVTAVHRLKNNYVMNNNGARNRALEEGRKRAKWVLPWDGNCFLTTDAWSAIYHDVIENPWYSHFVVPMARMLSNEDLLSNATPPEPVEEPQLIFRRDSQETFNADFCYGRRPKVELFWRLGIPGKWDGWRDDPWDQPRQPESPEAYRFGMAGWVARLYSGMGNLEQNTTESFKNRGRVRQDAIITTLRYLDRRLKAQSANAQALQCYSEDAIQSLACAWQASPGSEAGCYAQSIIDDAQAALARGPYSVVDKTTLPPSGDRHDYWHPAPYWWPNPETADGLPYVRRDGERVPGTHLYEAESERYDRSRLQRLFDDSTSLAIAWKLTGNDAFIEHAIALFRRFFIDPETRMNPHLAFSQVRLGHDENRGSASGVIEFKDAYFYLDAVRIMMASGKLVDTDQSRFSAWLGDYQQWLISSPQGLSEMRANNNHGTYYDLQLAAISAFLDDEATLYETLARAQSRIPVQVADDGRQPEELARTDTAHYSCFNLQGLLSLAQLGRRWGVELFHPESGASRERGLVEAVDWLLKHYHQPWPYEQINPFDSDRMLAVAETARQLGEMLPDSIPATGWALKPRFNPHDGIMPYLVLASDVSVSSGSRQPAD